MSSRIGRAKLFLFLRCRRHELFATAVQEAVATIFRARPQGQPPVPPAQLALGTLRQGYRGVSDAEALAAVRLGRRWPLVRDGLACAAPPLRKATVGRFRAALIKPGMDRRLGEGTLELATPVRFDRIFRNRIFQALYDGARIEWRVILA